MKPSGLITSPEPKTLPDFLATISDWRRGQGRMHPLLLILVIIIMATMSGYHGQRATGDFVRRNTEDLIKALKPKNNKLPSYQTIARVMQRLDYSRLTQAFFGWAKTVVPMTDNDTEKIWASFDGKAISGTTQDAGTARQTYTNLVSLFVHKTGQVLTQGKVAGKTNEIPLVAGLVQRLGLTGFVFTADAIHCQKQTVQAIIASGNDYVIGVKDNQRNLHTQLKKTVRPHVLSQAT